MVSSDGLIETWNEQRPHWGARRGIRKDGRDQREGKKGDSGRYRSQGVADHKTLVHMNKKQIPITYEGTGEI